MYGHHDLSQDFNLYLADKACLLEVHLGWFFLLTLSLLTYPNGTLALSIVDYTYQEIEAGVTL